MFPCIQFVKQICIRNSTSEYAQPVIVYIFYIGQRIRLQQISYYKYLKNSTILFHRAISNISANINLKALISSQIFGFLDNTTKRLHTALLSNFYFGISILSADFQADTFVKTVEKKIAKKMRKKNQEMINIIRLVQGDINTCIFRF